MTSAAPTRPMDHDEQKRASAVARGLLTGWYARADSPLVGTRKRKFHQQQLALAHGLCAHVHYLAGPALDLLDKGQVLAALPLVRSCFESAITAQWVTQTTDGAPAFVNEDVRQRRAHVQTLEKAVSRVFREAAPEVAANLIDPLETNATAKGFHNVCNDLVPGGADSYSIYRVLSQFSHASVVVIDSYLQATDTGPGLALRTGPVEPNAATWTTMLAASLVWAGRAVDYLDRDRIRRSELRAAATCLGITSELKLSEAAVLREAKAKETKRKPAEAPS
jgi:hypothetical protein